MGEAVLCGQKRGSSKINGIIENYKVYAGENVSAGDFIQFINAVISGEVTDTTAIQISNVQQSGYFSTFDACKLDENRIFVAYSPSDRNVYGMILTISDTGAITVGNPSIIAQYCYGSLKVFAMNSEQVFLVYCYGTYYSLYGLVITISGDTMTSETSGGNQINSSGDGYWFGVAELVKGEKYFVTYGDEYVESSSYLKGIIVIISDTVVSVGTSEPIVSEGHSGVNISVTAMSDSKVFITHKYSSSAFLSGIVCTISGSSITTGTRTTIISNTDSGQFTYVKALNDSKVIVSYPKKSSYEWNAVICTVDNRKITVGTPYTMSSITNTCRYDMSMKILANGNIMVMHPVGNDRLCCNVINVDDTSISVVADDFTISTGTNSGFSSILTFLKDDVFVALYGYGDNYYMFGQYFSINGNDISASKTAFEYELQVKKTTTSQFDGIAKTSGSAYEIIEVYTL